MSSTDATSVKQFRLTATYMLLTYASHDIAEKFKEKFQDKKHWNISWAEEKGETEHNHTHIVIEFTKRLDIRNERYFDIEDHHPNMKVLPRRKAYLDAIEYLEKEDGKKDIIDTEIGWADKLKDMTLEEAIDLHGIRNVNNTVTAWNIMNKPKIDEKIEEYYDNHSWQFEIEKLVWNGQNTRFVNWYYDRVGNTGKSRLCRHLRIKYPKDVRVLSNMGGMKDFATIIENYIKCGWNGKMLLLDLPRDAETKSIYEPIEAIKNGFLNSVKYQGNEILLPYRPAVIVLANFIPNFKKLSRDRWHFFTIYPNSSNTIASHRQPPSGRAVVCDGDCGLSDSQLNASTNIKTSRCVIDEDEDSEENF